MADELDVLLEKVADPGLRAELRAAVDKVRAKRSFGLVFESHLPERVRLPEYPVRRGTTVVRRADKRGEPMKVAAVRRGQATVLADDGTRETVPVSDLVVVAEFGEPATTDSQPFAHQQLRSRSAIRFGFGSCFVRISAISPENRAGSSSSRSSTRRSCRYDMPRANERGPASLNIRDDDDASMKAEDRTERSPAFIWSAAIGRTR